ncbi:serine/threonine protein kinase [Candidatus Bathyarchaeota archaeon]|nr:MAG: serine/threonine protein kinase [Candidatus Bathyarchaeota archaeon]
MDIFFFRGMSSAEIAVKTLSHLESGDFRILTVIELDMSRHRYVPEEDITRLSGLPIKEVKYRLDRLSKFGLIYRWVGSYVGYTLSTVGYDCLAMNSLVKADLIDAFGKPLGVGKESDVYDALTPEGRRVAVKFHRLGRTSFRQTRRLRGYVADRRHISWLYQSRLAAEKEFEALKTVYPHGVSVPEPIGQNRHVVVMDFIDGVELYRVPEVPNAEEVLDEILENVKVAYQKAKVIHADLSEFNVVLKPDFHILIIDWPQFVKTDHPNAEMLLERDVKNILKFFKRRFNIEKNVQSVLERIKST